MGDRTEEQLEEVEALEQIYEDDEGALEVVSREPPITVRITVRACALRVPLPRVPCACCLHARVAVRCAPVCLQRAWRGRCASDWARRPCFSVRASAATPGVSRAHVLRPCAVTTVRVRRWRSLSTATRGGRQ